MNNNNQVNVKDILIINILKTNNQEVGNELLNFQKITEESGCNVKISNLVETFFWTDLKIYSQEKKLIQGEIVKYLDTIIL